jgi:hypothetical protein
MCIALVLTPRSRSISRTYESLLIEYVDANIKVFYTTTWNLCGNNRFRYMNFEGTCFEREV